MIPRDRAIQAIRDFAFWNYGLNDTDPNDEYAEWVPALADKVVAAMNAPVAGEPRRVLVLGACGHWWRESQPDGFRMTDAPRVCAACPIGIRDDEGYSSQGLRLVPVTYLTDWTEHETKEN